MRVLTEGLGAIHRQRDSGGHYLGVHGVNLERLPDMLHCASNRQPGRWVVQDLRFACVFGAGGELLRVQMVGLGGVWV